MRVGLIDVDGKMPNLALMKISAWHKAQGDEVKWHDPLFDHPERVYASKIFAFTPDYNSQWPDCEIIRGGTGYDIYSRLPDEIEDCDPDYSIYPNCDYSIQLFSRGCIRKCPFCVVHQKEGNISPRLPMKLNPAGKHIEIMDNNFFANPQWRNAAMHLKIIDQPVNLHGVDIRIIDDEQAAALNQLRHIKQIHIAWDNPKDELTDKIKLLVKHVKAYKVMCYVLIGYWSTPEQDLYRVMKLKELGIDPFVMPYDKQDAYQNKFARWVNHKAVFKSCSWENYRQR